MTFKRQKPKTTNARREEKEKSKLVETLEAVASGHNGLKLAVQELYNELDSIKIAHAALSRVVLDEVSDASAKIKAATQEILDERCLDTTSDDSEDSPKIIQLPGT